VWKLLLSCNLGFLRGPQACPSPHKVLYERLAEVVAEQDESSRPGSDGRISEGDAMSLIMLWLDFAILTDKLAKEASQCQEHAIADDLRAESSAYMAAAYEAGRMRVDEETMSLLNRPAAVLYSTTTRMTLESTTMRPEELLYIRTTTRP
jgi:hypothetical protein